MDPKAPRPDEHPPPYSFDGPKTQQEYSNPNQGYRPPNQGYPNPSQGYAPSPMNPGYPNPSQGYPNSPTNPGYPNPSHGYPNPNQGYTPYPQPNFPPGSQGPPAPGYQDYPNIPPQSMSPYPPGGYVPPGHVPMQQQMMPIMQQPTSGGPPMPDGWMNIPLERMNCPQGLEYLSMIDQLLVHQKVELLEVLIGFETNNKFTIKNSIGQKVYYAVEDTDCLSRNCCGPMRPFEMKILDNFRNQIMSFNRPLACDSCCFPCCLQSMEVSAPPGNIIGTIEQEWSLCKPEFVIKDTTGQVVLRITGPMCRFTFCGDVEFQILSKDSKTVVGKISKQWSGMIREMFTDSDYFGITFPMDLDVKMKAVCLGALFLIDAMFFEKSGNRESDGIGML